MKTYTECLANNFKSNIEKNLNEKLKINNIEAQQVSLNINIDENDSISILGADVILNDSQKNVESKVISVIQNEIGETKVNIIYGGENE